MNFAAVLELVTIIAYIVILAGGKQKRQNEWKLLGALLLVTGAVQCAAMAIVVSLPSFGGFVVAGILMEWIGLLL